MLNETELQRCRKEQARADLVYREHGRMAPPPVAGERFTDYQSRLLEPMQRYSDTWKAVKLREVAVQPAALKVAADAIYADAVREARSPRHVPEGTLREIKRQDQGGREVSEFYGDPEACWGPFKMPPRQARFLKNQNPLG